MIAVNVAGRNVPNPALVHDSNSENRNSFRTTGRSLFQTLERFEFGCIQVDNKHFVQ